MSLRTEWSGFVQCSRIATRSMVVVAGGALTLLTVSVVLL